MSGAYVVKTDGGTLGASLRNGVDTAVLFANNSADAKAYAEAEYAAQAPAPWAAATPALVAAGTDLLGWTLRVTLTAPLPANYDPAHTYSTNDRVFNPIDGQVYKSTTGSTGDDPTDKAHWVLLEGVGSPAVDQTYTGVAMDTFDLFGAAMAVLLNADPSALIAGSAYDAATQILTVAATTDNLGAYSLGVTFSPPGNERVHVPGFVVATDDHGATGDDVSLTFAADAYTIPNVVAQVRRS